MSLPAHRRRGSWSCLAALAVLAGSCLAPESAVADKAPADQGLIRPTARRRIPIKDYETSSEAPFGGSRFGGSETRPYAISPDGKRLATMDAGQWQLEMWDLEKGKSLGRFGRFGESAAVAFSPDGKRLYSVGGSTWTHNIFNVEAWDVARCSLLRSLDEGMNLTAFGAVAVSPDGKTLALAKASSWNRHENSPPGVHFWNAKTGDEERRVRVRVKATDRNEVDCSLAYSPSGRMLALAVDGRVSLIETATGKERCVLADLPPAYRPGGGGTPGGRAVAFSPDGKTLALGCNDGSIRLYDVRTGTPLAPLLGHEGRVEALRYTGPDTLLSFGFDRFLLTWSMAEVRRGPASGDKLTDAELRRCWDDLGGKDARKVFLAARALAAAPASALPFLGKRLVPVKPIDAARAKVLSERVRDAEYSARREAARELLRMGEDVLPIVTLVMSDHSKGYREAQPLVSVADRLKQASPGPDRLRSLRALQALEAMKGDESRKLLAALAKGEPKANLTVEAKAALDRIAARYVPTPDVPVGVLWKKLGSQDARTAFSASRELTGRPEVSVPLLSKELLALAKQPDDEANVLRLIADLGDDQFAKREAASVALRKKGREALPALSAALAKTTDPEQKKRIEAILSDGGKSPVVDVSLQADRALEVLHAVGTAEARRTLALVAKDAKQRWLREAAGSLVGPAK